ncbi:hypothetical protein PMG71_05335 [Roseofilum sp. BLCC_M154]|uniref:Uncharacterized protein n=1 Tax=Roseofilum acuticapitatum BLCC-M154 TaxID=3022444 RepID=A0ABT7APN0_9CYAN|nr:hypothetical protein [Roseofilum acuticapitatum]MDJ1168842.1 hypothetical protein [Roseofilum acuticapitatum BLCC-M154]
MSNHNQACCCRCPHQTQCCPQVKNQQAIYPLWFFGLVIMVTIMSIRVNPAPQVQETQQMSPTWISDTKDKEDDGGLVPTNYPPTQR